MNELKNFLQNRRNAATLIALLVMVALLPLGLYLGQLQQIFFSRASGTLIQVGDGNCVTTDSEGNKALKCGTVPLVLYNPFVAACDQASVSAVSASPQITGGNYQFNATSTCGSDAQYKFLVKPPGGNWEMVRDWDSSSSFTWNTSGKAAGNYEIGVHAKSASGKVFQSAASLPYTLSAIPTCEPRPNVVKQVSMTAQGMSVTLSAGTNASTPTNAMSQIVFTGFINGTATIGDTVYTQNATYAVPSGTTQVTFLIKQVTYGQETRINYTVKDSCGDFTTFDGGNTGANWPAPPVACQPPPDMGRPAFTKIPGGIRVTRIAQPGATNNTPNNLLTGFNITGLSNVRIDFNGRTYKSNTNIDLRSSAGSCSASACTDQGPQGVKSITFDVYLVNNNLGGTAFFTMVDSCRGITDFAGATSRSEFGDGAPPPELPAP